MLLTLRYDAPLSNGGFKSNLRRYTAVFLTLMSVFTARMPEWQGLTLVHFWLNAGTFCWIRWVHGFPPVYYIRQGGTGRYDQNSLG